MIRYLEKGEYGKCRLLWREAFPEDSERFVEYYFSRKLVGSRVLVKEGENGEILTMAHLNPYKVMVRGRLYKLPYIVGVATAVNSRRRGHMRDVLTKMLRDMHEEGTPFCYLMPAAPEIYRPFGFTYVFDRPVWKLGAAGKKARRVGICLDGTGPDGTDPDGIYFAEWINRWLSARFEVYAERNREYMEMLQAELDAEEGHVWGLLDNQGKLEALLAFWGIGKKEQRFLYCAREEWIQPGDLEADRHPAIMARIANVKAMAEVISVNKDCPCSRMEVFLRIHDKLVVGNDGLWRWSLGPDGSSLIREQGDGPVLYYKNDFLDGEDTLRSTEVLDITIDGLASWLFGYSNIEGGLGEDGESERPFWLLYVRTLEGIYLDEIV